VSPVSLPFIIEVTYKPALHERDMLAAPLLAYNEALLGPPGTHPVAVLIRIPDDARVLGGLWGRTSFHWLFIELLFIPTFLRGQGLGTQLLEKAEKEAKARGCLGAWLDTFSTDACRFYQQRGYQLFGTISDYPPGSVRSFLSKRFLV
jgi:GNAT superfamily N-acetyltransferase